MPAIRLPSRALKGLSFSVPELVLIKNWSAANGLRMVVRLDHGSDAEDFEEVLAFHLGDSPLCPWIMWRGKRSVFIQPLIGRTQRYHSVAEAFESMAARQRSAVSDIEAVRWPV